MGSDKKLGIIYKGETIWLSWLRNPSQFLLPDTIAQKYGKGGTQFVRDVLGISVKPLELRPKQRKEKEKGRHCCNGERETLLQCRGAENYLCQHLQPRLQRISV